MDTKRTATTAAIICVLAICLFIAGLAINSTWLSVAAICVVLLSAIFAMAFYLQGR